MRSLYSCSVLAMAEVLDYIPGWEDRNCPQAEIDVDTTDLAHDRDRGQTIRYRLPSRLCTSKQCRISHDLRLGFCKMMDDEISCHDQPSTGHVVLRDLQEKIVDLKPNGE